MATGTVKFFNSQKGFGTSDAKRAQRGGQRPITDQKPEAFSLLVAQPHGGDT
jgi:hypothetical protein